MSSRFQPSGTPAFTWDPQRFGANPTAADIAFELAQGTAYNAVQKFIASAPSDAVQLQLLAIKAPLTVATLSAAGCSTTYYPGTAISRPLIDADVSFITDWTATLTQMQATLKQIS